MNTESNIVAKVKQQIREKKELFDYNIVEYPAETIIQLYNELLEGVEKPMVDFCFWSEDKQSKFIESLFLGLPIPYILTSETEDAKLEFIDGKERIQAINLFMQNKLRLKNLEILTCLNGLTFKDLLLSSQRRFQGTTLRMIILTSKCNKEMKQYIIKTIIDT